ncbi:hypothetical protein HN51_018931 [Arachis hypogaea]
MVVDPIDEIVDQNMLGVDGRTIHHIETSDAWSRWRDQLAQEMSTWYTLVPAIKAPVPANIAKKLAYYADKLKR